MACADCGLPIHARTVHTRPRPRTRHWLHTAAFRTALLTALVTSLLSGCADGFQPLSVADAPLDLRAVAVRVDAVRLTWTAVSQLDVVSYVVERRTDLRGAFAEVAQVPQSSLGEVVWLDTDVEPERFYGYRVVSVTKVGDRSGPSLIGGALTPPLPGIEITTSTLVTAADAIDPDGYEVIIAGPDTVRASLGVQARRRFSPLRPGTYAVTLNGLISRCSVGSNTLQVVVMDSTATTIAPVSFQVTCRDPNRGDIAVAVSTTGGDLDPSVVIDVLGEASDESLPTAERTYSSTRNVERTSGRTTFTDLRPGTYDVSIGGIAANCALEGTRTRTVGVTKLGSAAVGFVVRCQGSTPPPNSNLPFVLRNRWTPSAVPNGGVVTLVSELDLTARTGQSVRGVQADYYYDATVLRYDSTIVARLPDVTVNSLVPGRLSILAASVSTARTGLVKLFEFAFTVIGAAGRTSESQTQAFKASTRVGSATVTFGDSVRVEEDTFTVASGSAVNQPPIAQAGGPYAGSVGAPIAMTSVGSSDADGNIVAYAWSFGDGTTASGAVVSKAYAAAGTFTVMLTVTDNAGATATDQATVTVSSIGAGNQAPIAQANGPYSATAGVATTLSSAGSSDPNGTIVSYSWSLGNGQSATGASPTVTYPTAGTYSITLTVTDNGGLAATDQATITVTSAAPVSGNLIWYSSFGPFDAGNNWVPLELSIDLSQNVAETPGIELVRTFVVDSLKWDPAKFQLLAVNLGPGISGSVNQAQSATGRVSLAGAVADAFQAGNSSRILTFATLRLRPIATSGTAGSVTTSLGAIQGPASTNFFVYNAKITVVDGSFTRP